jgi:ribosomal protein S18 acetylase RimI-like enzyme
MTERFTLRPATVSDEGQVAGLFAEIFRFHAQYDPLFTMAEGGGAIYAKWFVKQIGEPDSLALVAESAGTIVGFCLALLRQRSRIHDAAYRQYGEVNDLAVSRGYRRLGIGAALISQAEDWFRTRGVSRIEAKVAVTNPVSAAFWKRNGFRPYLESVFREI